MVGTSGPGTNWTKTVQHVAGPDGVMIYSMAGMNPSRQRSGAGARDAGLTTASTTKSADGTKRAAHRPSRRDVVVAEAMSLCSVRSIEDVTVADIAGEAQMSSAAIYFHYRSKEELLLEGLRVFAQRIVAQLRAGVDADPGVSLGDVIVSLLEWTDTERSASLVYFVRSPGWSNSIEQLRQETRHELVRILSTGLRVRRHIPSGAKQATAAAALVGLLEVSASSWLTEDFVFVDLGRRRFAREVRELAADISGS